MKKIYSLEKKLNLLQLQMKKYSKENIDVSSLSLSHFLRYKYCKKKMLKVQYDIVELYDKRNQIISWYNSLTNEWIQDFKVNTIKYNKLEKKANYRKKQVLYKLGFETKKPIHPMFQIFSPLKQSLSSSFSHLRQQAFQKQQKLHSSISKRISKKIHSFALNSTMFAIKGYTNIQNDIGFAKKYMASKNTFKFMKNIFAEANYCLNNNSKIAKSGSNLPFSNEISSQTNASRFSIDSQRFRDSIKFVPQESNFSNNTILQNLTKRSLSKTSNNTIYR